MSLQTLAAVTTPVSSFPDAVDDSVGRISALHHKKQSTKISETPQRKNDWTLCDLTYNFRLCSATLPLTVPLGVDAADEFYSTRRNKVWLTVMIICGLVGNGCRTRDDFLESFPPYTTRAHATKPLRIHDLHFQFSDGQRQAATTYHVTELWRCITVRFITVLIQFQFAMILVSSRVFRRPIVPFILIKCKMGVQKYTLSTP